MKPIDKLLVAIDFSDHSLPSLAYAARLAHALKARLILASILNERDVKTIHTTLAGYDPDLVQQTVEDRLAERKSRLSELAAAAEADTLVMKAIVRVDVPHQGLLHIIAEENPDLLILGTKGRGALADTIVGSCAQKLFRRCPIPLLSLRQA